MVEKFSDMSLEQLEQSQLFFPYTTDRTRKLIERKGRFVHYTTADVAMSIIQNSEIWMRNATTMNDWSEVEHGFQCLHAAWSRPEAQPFRDFLENLHPGFCKDLTDRFDGWLPDLRTNTYLTCLSEHLDAEDHHGRLSMWRAYGGRNGVALVLNLAPFEAMTDELKAYSSPVAYLDKAGFLDQFTRTTTGMIQRPDLVMAYSRDHLLELVFTMFRYAALCTKHPGFEEELEWRVIYSPNLAASRVIEPEVRSVRGAPQIIQKIPLRDAPDDGLHGASIPSILDRLIIGPTADALTSHQAFVALLEAAGVKDAINKVIISDIPLRH